MDEMTGRWGLCQWFEEHGTDIVHPDDLEAFRRFLPNGKVFQCLCQEGDYLVLRYGDLRFRVRPLLFKPVPVPSTKIGDRVRIRSNGEVLPAVITGMAWHFQRSEPYYSVTVNGKERSKRYWQSDFVER